MRLARSQLNNVVTIFRSAIATTTIAPALFRSLLFGSWLSPVVIVFLEASKRTNPVWIQYSAVLVLSLAQGGGLVWVPLYYIAYLVLGPRPSARPPAGEDATGAEKAGAYDHPNELYAVLPAVVVGYLIPALVLENPLISLTQHQQDWINFTWQAFPLTVGLLIPLMRFTLPTTYSSAHAVEQSTLLWTGAICRVIHLTSLVELFRHSFGPRDKVWSTVSQLASPGKVAPLSRFIYQFLLLDMALIVFATAYFILAVPGKTQTSRWRMLLVMLVGAVVQGPGASLAWGWRTRRKEAAVGLGNRNRS